MFPIFATALNTEDSFEENKYLWSMYFVITIFTATPYRTPLPVTYYEMLFTSIVAFGSLVWIGLILADLMSTLHSTVDTSYHHAAKAVLVSFFTPKTF